jgi:hypothetical protein
MFARSSIGRVVRRPLVFLFTIVVEATLVIGLVLVILAPGADGGYKPGPDRPPIPLTSQQRN